MPYAAVFVAYEKLFIDGVPYVIDDLVLDTLTYAVFVLLLSFAFVAVTTHVSVTTFLPIDECDNVFPDKLNLLLPFEVIAMVDVPVTLSVLPSLLEV